VKEKDKVFIEHILESITFIQSYMEQLTKEEFLSSREKQDAIIRRLEIIGEAVKNLSPELKQERPNVPWRQIAGMRDVLDPRIFRCGFGANLENGAERLTFFEAGTFKPNRNIRELSTNGQFNDNVTEHREIPVFLFFKKSVLERRY